MPKSYGQFCALARALDRVGDRWTLLIVRELLLGPASFGELHTALDGIPSNLLAERLRLLTADGIARRDASESDRRRVTYSLTTLGQGLEPVVDALIVWGAHWMTSGPGDDRFEARWAALALRALLADRPATFEGTVEFRFETDAVRIGGTAARPRRGRRTPPRSTPETTTVDGPAALLLALAAGQLDVAGAEEQGVIVTGSRKLLTQLLPRTEIRYGRRR